jgi:hypothetical protein
MCVHPQQQQQRGGAENTSSGVVPSARSGDEDGYNTYMRFALASQLSLCNERLEQMLAGQHKLRALLSMSISSYTSSGSSSSSTASSQNPSCSWRFIGDVMNKTSAVFMEAKREWAQCQTNWGAVVSACTALEFRIQLR